MVLFFTVIAVSLDAYLAGLAYNLKRKMTLPETIYVASFTFFVCVIAFTLNFGLIESLPFVKEAGAGIFVYIGAKNYLGRFAPRGIARRREPKELWLVGLAVSADAGLASLSLPVPAEWAIPVYAFFMFVAHLGFLILGSATVRLIGVMERLSSYSGAIMIAIGVYKMLA